jgi:hypothetical protein
VFPGSTKVPVPLFILFHSSKSIPTFLFRVPSVVISENDVVRYTPHLNHPTSRPPTGPGFHTCQHSGQREMQADLKEMQAKRREKAQARRARAKAIVKAKAKAKAKAVAKAQTTATATARAEARDAWWKAWKREAGELRRVKVRLGHTVARAWAEAQTHVQARADDKARKMAQALAQALWPAELKPMADAFTYAEVLADSKLKGIISSIEDTKYRHRLACHLYRRSHRRPHTLQEYWWFIQIVTPITRLPPELLHQILFITIDEASDSPLVLMRVCKYWRAMVNGIWASLKLETRTPKDDVKSKLKELLDVLVDTETNRHSSVPLSLRRFIFWDDYEAIFAAAETTSRWRSFIVETFPAHAAFPTGWNHGLQQCPNAVMSRLRTFKIKCPCEMSPLLDRLLYILGTTANGELTTVEINSANVISFLVPTYSSIFRSVKVLSLDTPGLPNLVDLLPHLYRLETLTASHLSFPVYHNDVDLPFVHTLRHLSLRAVSIQWMSGRTLHALESCTLLLPLHHHVLHTFSTTLPICKNLTFEGYPLDILHGVSAHSLTRLSVRSSSSYKPRGNRQLVQFSIQALRESRLAPQILHISIEAANQAWTKAFTFMPSLEELVISNAQPSSLGVKVLQSLVVQPDHGNNLDTATPLGRNTPVCPSLKRFGLRYRRWLRPSEHFDLIPEFVSVIWSRQQSKFSLKSFRIWIGTTQKDPLELIEGSWMSFEGFERLANYGAIKGENVLVDSGLWRVWV